MSGTKVTKGTAYFGKIVVEDSRGNVGIGQGTNGANGPKVGYGANNIAIGENANGSAIDSDDVVAIGRNSLQYASDYADGAVVIGQNAVRNINQLAGAKFNDLVAIGNKAMEGGGRGYSVAIGSHVMQYITTGNTNVAVGPYSGQAITTGSNNVFMGGDSGSNVTTGSNNIVIGNLAQASSATVSNQITLGDSSITTLRCQVTTITALSDVRDKSNIADSSFGLDLIARLRPVTFTWNMRDGGKVGVNDLGFIAQELAAVEDELDAHTTLQLTYRDNPDKLEASYGRLVPVLVKAVQELREMVLELKAEAGR